MRTIPVVPATRRPRQPVWPPANLGWATEEAFLADVLKAARALGWKSYHTRLARRSDQGWPDVVLAKPGRLLIFELKMPGKRPTPDQLAWVAILQSCGIDARVVYPQDWDLMLTLLQGKA